MSPEVSSISQPLAQARRRTRVIPALALLALTVLFGCGHPPREALRVGINSWPGYEFIYLAQELGYYAAEGVDVRVVEFDSLSDSRRAYERGQIDALGTTLVETLLIREHSRRSPQIVQVVDSSEGADVFLAQPGLTQGVMLRGRRIGVELGSVGVYVLARGLERLGLSLCDIEPVSMDQTSMLEAFRSGDLAAMVTYPPFSLKLLRDTQAVTLFSSADIPGEVLDVLVIEESWATQRSSEVARFLRAFRRAVEYSEAHPAEAYRIMAAREGLTPDEFARMLREGIRCFTRHDQAPFLQPDGRVAQLLAHTDRILRATGQIKGEERTAGMIGTGFAGSTL